MDTMSDIRQTFFEECDEQLAELEAGLLAMNEGACDAETVNAVFRAVHSIKGGAGAFRLDALVAFSHKFETVLDQIRSNGLTPDLEVMRVMLRAADALADLVAASRSGDEIDESQWKPLAAELEALLTSTPAGAAGGHDEVIDFQASTISFESFAALPPVSRHSIFNIRFRARPGLYASANEPAVLLRELAKLGTAVVECDTQHVPLLDVLSLDGGHFVWYVRLESEASIAEIEEIFEFVEGDCELEISRADDGSPAGTPTAEVGPDVDAEIAALLAAVRGDAAASEAAVPEADAALESQPESGGDDGGRAGPVTVNASAGTAAKSTIRVDLERVDRLINLVGELVINQAMLSQRVVAEGYASASNVMIGLDELEQLTREIQESVMAIRAQPIKPLFQRMSRIVREVCDNTGKDVRLRTEGDATEIDKTVIERLADPLTHMIRNAVDHGIESAETRLAAGKPEAGTVYLSAAHRSGRVVIEVSDDGGGIDRMRVRQKAIEKGLIAADAQLSDVEIDNLLFMPGFSTAQKVSSISGRGVGMDVVKRSIQSLGGRISITSTPGKGSTFSLSLPLTLAVLDGMVVTVAEQTLVVPLTAIVETLIPSVDSIHSLGGEAKVMSIRGSFVPLIDVGRELGFSHSSGAQGLDRVAILVESERGGRHALLFDAIQDQRQVVIKSLETNFGKIFGIAAATILGDGRVALILDVDAIVSRPGAELAGCGREERKGARAK